MRRDTDIYLDDLTRLQRDEHLAPEKTLALTTAAIRPDGRRQRPASQAATEQAARDRRLHRRANS